MAERTKQREASAKAELKLSHVLVGLLFGAVIALRADDGTRLIRLMKSSKNRSAASQTLRLRAIAKALACYIVNR